MDKLQSSVLSLQSLIRRDAGGALFCVLAAALLAFLFRDALLYGHVLGQADYLFAFPPWDSLRPLGHRIGNPLMGDIPTVFFPFLLHARTAVLNGEFPLWISGMGAGQPFFGAFQSAVLSPFTALAFVLPFPGGLTAVAAARLLVGGVGMYLFLRAMPLGQPAAVVGALAYLLNPFAIVWLEHPVSAVSAWLPWLLLGVELTVSRSSRRSVAGLAVIVALTLLSGHPETAFKMFMLTGAYAAYRGYVAGQLVRSVVLVAAAGLLGALLTSIQLIPFFEYLSHSRVLADRSISTPLYISPPAAFVTTFVPDFYGTPIGRRFVLDGTNYCEQQLYAGAATWLLAAMAFLHDRFRGRAIFFLTAGAISVLIMYGTIVTRVVVTLLPPLQVAALSRFGLIAITGLAISAAIGADAWFSRPEEAAADPRHRRLAIAATLMGAAIAVTVLGFLIVNRDWLTAVRQWPLTLNATGWSSLLLAATLAAIWLAPFMRRSAVIGVTVALIAIDLLTFADGFHPTLPAEHSFPAVAALETPRQDRDLFRVAGWRDTLLPNTALVYGLNDFRSYDGMGMREYSRFLDIGFHFNGSSHELVHASLPHLIDLLNVKYILAPEAAELPADRFERVRGGKTRLLRNLRVQPRAFLADSYVLLNGTEALRAIRDGKVDLTRSAVLHEALAPDQAPEGASGLPGTATIQHYTDHMVTIETRAAGRRLLVLSDAFYPGWVATLDGADVPIVRANDAFRAVAVPAGQHVIEFRYRPASFRYGVALSAVGIVVLVMLLVPTRRARGLP